MTALAEKEPSVTVGKVVGWTDGRSQVESEGGYEDTSFFAVLKVDVEKSYRGSDGQGAGDALYVEVPRGGEVRVDGKRPPDTEPVLSTIEELNSAVPKGTRVIVVGRAAPTAAELKSQTPGSTVRNADAGRPAGADLLSPHVQGLIFEDEQGNFVSGLAGDENEWGWVPSNRRAGDGFSYLVDQLATLDG